jgi:hypothetical protein
MGLNIAIRTEENMVACLFAGIMLDRRGELFYYMHQQMLARYDAERISNGLGSVIAFSQWDKPVKEVFFDYSSSCPLAFQSDVYNISLHNHKMPFSTRFC